MTKKRNLVLVLCLVLVTALVSVGGTLAWLRDVTDPVTNTFTVGNVDITLAETTGDTYQMIPGTEYEKDPTITVAANSEECYVFVKVELLNNLTKFVTYEMDAAWTELTSEPGVFYQIVSKNAEAAQSLVVLKDNMVTIKEGVTKEDLNLSAAQYPKMVFTAYAVQVANVDGVGEAWTLAKEQEKQNSGN